MKIVCDSCGTKYSIADEKVRGKVFKIRCRKCSQVIVVRGTNDQPATAESEPDRSAERAAEGAQEPASEAGGSVDAVWHLVIDRERLGPLTATDVRDRFLQGTISSETFTWREGFPDWIRLAQVPDFADLAASTRAQLPTFSTVAAQHAQSLQASQASAAQPQVASVQVQQQAAVQHQPTSQPQLNAHVAQASSSSGGSGLGLLPGRKAGGRNQDEFPDVSLGGSQPLPELGAQAGAREESSGDGDLFSSTPHATSSHHNGNGASHGGDSAANRMTGQRNDNSVLFSLNNLATLGNANTKKAAPSPASTPRTSGGSEPSGLIDIRAMAATLAIPQSGSNDGSPEVISSGFAPVAAPILIPVAPSSSTPRWLIPVLAGVGGLLMVLVAVLVYLVSNGGLGSRSTNVAIAPTGGSGGVVGTTGADQPGATMPAVGTAPSPSGVVGTPPAGGAEVKGGPAGTPTAGTPGGEPTPSGASPGGAGAAAEPAGDRTATGPTHGPKPGATRPVPRPTAGHPTANAKGASPTPRGSAGDASRPPASAEPPAPKPPKPSGAKPGGDELDDLLNRATGSGGGAGPKARPAPEPAEGGAAGGADGVPETLSVRELQKGMASVRPAVLACGADSPVKGVANVRVTISSSGKVTNVKVASPFAGEAAGSCIERAVRDASFPRFQRAALTIDYPYTIR